MVDGTEKYFRFTSGANRIPFSNRLFFGYDSRFVFSAVEVAQNQAFSISHADSIFLTKIHLG